MIRMQNRISFGINENKQISNKNIFSSQPLISNENVFNDKLSSKASLISFQCSYQVGVKKAVFKALQSLDSSLKNFDRNVNRISIDSETRQIKVEGNKQLENDLKVIAKAFPDVIKTHCQKHRPDQSVLTHILEVTKSLVTDNEYLHSNIPPKDKILLKLMTLFHDTGKDFSQHNEIPGFLHTESSARKSEKALEKFGLSKKEIESISVSIKMHHWVSRFQKKIETKEFIAEQFANCPDAFKFCVMLSKADISGGGNKEYLNKFNTEIYPKVTSEIEALAYKFSKKQYAKI